MRAMAKPSIVTSAALQPERDEPLATACPRQVGNRQMRSRTPAHAHTSPLPGSTATAPHIADDSEASDAGRPIGNQVPLRHVTISLFAGSCSSSGVG
jgi:hypothetical protein